MFLLLFPTYTLTIVEHGGVQFEEFTSLHLLYNIQVNLNFFILMSVRGEVGMILTPSAFPKILPK